MVTQVASENKEIHLLAQLRFVTALHMDFIYGFYLYT